MSSREVNNLRNAIPSSDYREGLRSQLFTPPTMNSGDTTTTTTDVVSTMGYYTIASTTDSCPVSATSSFAPTQSNVDHTQQSQSTGSTPSLESLWAEFQEWKNYQHQINASVQQRLSENRGATTSVRSEWQSFSTRANVLMQSNNERSMTNRNHAGELEAKVCRYELKVNELEATVTYLTEQLQVLRAAADAAKPVMGDERSHSGDYEEEADNDDVEGVQSDCNYDETQQPPSSRSTKRKPRGMTRSEVARYKVRTSKWRAETTDSAIEDWIVKLHREFVRADIPDLYWGELLYERLEGRALSYISSLYKDPGDSVISWDFVCNQLRHQYGKRNKKLQAQTELTQMKQEDTETLEDWSQRVSETVLVANQPANPYDDNMQEKMAEVFREGLADPKLREALVNNYATTLKQAVEDARRSKNNMLRINIRSNTTAKVDKPKEKETTNVVRQMSSTNDTRQEQQKRKAFNNQSRNGNRRFHKPSSPRRSMVCYNCNEEGHGMHRCPKPLNAVNLNKVLGSQKDTQSGNGHKPSASGGR